MMFVVGILSILTALTAVKAKPLAKDEVADCKYHLQLLFNMDGTYTFIPFLEQLGKDLPQVMEALQADYPAMEVGVSVFSDKPLPFVGVGPYNNLMGYAFDTCYVNDCVLTQDVEEAATALKNANSHSLSGMDLYEGHLEAFIRGAEDKQFGWATETHDEDGLPYAKVMVMMTDAFYHKNGDMKEIMDYFRTPRDETGENGAFGNGWARNKPYTTHWDTELAGELAALMYEKEFGSGIQGVDAERYEELYETFNVDTFPLHELQEHPGDGSLDCSLTDYPTEEQTTNSLKRNDIIPLMIFVNDIDEAKDANAKVCRKMYGDQNTLGDCFEKSYGAMFDKAGIPYSLSQYKGSDPLDITKIVIEAITKAVDLKCFPKTTTKGDDGEVIVKPIDPIDEDTTTKAVQPLDPIIIDPIVGETTTKPVKPIDPFITQPVDLTETPETVEPVTNSVWTDGITTTQEITYETSEEELLIPIIPIGGITTTTEATEEPITDAKSSNGTGAIVGAAGGAAAAAGAVAAAAMWAKKAGFLFGNNSTPTFDATPQVDVDEQVLDRSAVEEVTMDMFR